MADSDQKRYQKYQRSQEQIWEAKCLRCGACCGSMDGDPCEHLVEDKNNRYYCSIYSNRFGPRKTRSGRKFVCVSIRKVLDQSWPGDECCGYKK
ncbi:MAG: hypothetical protein H6755_07005 [Candidatus Omnitrophica bacterium]|nr:hypothetical protein [Candidatus Omnitrophota bacterium]MCB9748139.1 hypothetical protein [Candidatus Omnitrophota bacterium]